MKVKDAKKELRIKTVTLDLVYQKGMAGVKMSEIAKRVKISPSNLYIYFKNKEDLLNTIFFDIMKLMRKDVIDEMHHDLPFKMRCYEVFKLIIDNRFKRIKEISFFKQFERSPYFKKEDHLKIEEQMKDIIGIFEEGRHKLILKDTVPVSLLMAVFMGTIHQLIEFELIGKIKLDESAIKQGFNLVWDSIRQ